MLPVITVKDAEQALLVANQLPLGLSGAVFAKTTSQARQIARRLETGNVCLNDTAVHYFCVESPLGGIKDSGLGIRHGYEAIRQFCWTETIVEDRPLMGPVSRTVMNQLRFPYQPRVRRVLRFIMRKVYG